MNDSPDALHLTKLERVLGFGVVACLLLATMELCHLLADEWVHDWVTRNYFVHRRIIYYGIAFGVSIPAVLCTTFTAFRGGRFAATLSRALLWYGVILLVSAIAVFVFDCLPEVAAGLVGAAIFAAAIFGLQRRYFTPARIAQSRLQRGRCLACDAPLRLDSAFCSACGTKVGHACPGCAVLIRSADPFCWHCGLAQSAAPTSGPASPLPPPAPPHP